MNMIKRITSICLAMMIALCFMPVFGIQEAYADGYNVGNITLDLRQENVSLSGSQLEAFNNVMQALHAKKEVFIMPTSKGADYDLDNTLSNTYEMTRLDGESDPLFYAKDSDQYNGGTWDKAISNEIQEELEGKKVPYCSRITIVFPTQYNIWVEGKQVTNSNAGNVTGDGTVSYDVATNTLTLNGAELAIKTKAGDTDAAAILSDDSLNINLKGNNIIAGNDAVTLPTIDVYGIKARGDSSGLNFSGQGNLNINIIQNGNRCYGIYAGDNISFERTNLNVTISNNKDNSLYGVCASGDISFVNGSNVCINANGKSGNNTIGLKTRKLSASNNSLIEATADGGESAANNGVGIEASGIDEETCALGARVKVKPDDEDVIELDRIVANDLRDYSYVRIPLNHVAHAWDDGIVNRKPTAEREGEMLFTCVVCGQTKTEPISNAAEKAAARAAKYTPSKATIKSVKKGKKRATVTWKTMKSVTGYQIRLTNKKNGKVKTVTVKQTKKVAKKKTVKKVVKKLSKKTKYGVQVRAYRTVGGETFYGPWSKTKNVKTR